MWEVLQVHFCHTLGGLHGPHHFGSLCRHEQQQSGSSRYLATTTIRARLPRLDGIQLPLHTRLRDNGGPSHAAPKERQLLVDGRGHDDILGAKGGPFHYPRPSPAELRQALHRRLQRVGHRLWRCSSPGHQAPDLLKVAAYERELISLVQAIRYWRPYLQGWPFIVRTNHFVLKFMLDQHLSKVPQD